MIILYLTCASDSEARKISNALLEDKLIVCARRSSISSSYWWDGKIPHDDEVLLMMESIEEKFEAIEVKVTELHSYDQFVLTAIPVVRTTSGVEKWLKSVITEESPDR